MFTRGSYNSFAAVWPDRYPRKLSSAHKTPSPGGQGGKQGSGKGGVTVQLTPAPTPGPGQSMTMAAAHRRALFTGGEPEFVRTPGPGVGAGLEVSWGERSFRAKVASRASIPYLVAHTPQPCCTVCIRGSYRSLSGYVDRLVPPTETARFLQQHLEPRSGGLSAILMNDTICLMMTPIVLTMIADVRRAYPAVLYAPGRAATPMPVL